ncbi:hypothetical protein FKM82_023013 [Ascaphus truei]
MQSIRIYIPTDAVDADAGSQCTTPKTATTPHEPDKMYMESSNLSCSEGGHTLLTERTHYMQTVSSPEEKLSRALMMAENFSKEKELLNANKELIRCVALSRIVHGDGHWKLAQAFANLAHGYLTLRGLPVQARQHAESAKNILLRGVDMSKSVEDKREILGTLLMIYYTLGMSHLLQKNGRESLDSLQKVEKIVEELEGLHERQAVIFRISETDITIALGRACLLQNELSSAIRYFEYAVDLVISSEGDSAPELVNLYQDMAKTEQMRKKHNRAIEHLLQAHSISQTIHRNVGVETAQTGLLLAKAYAASGKHEYNHFADKYFRESLGAYQTVLGPADPQTLSTLVEFSKWLIQIGHKEEAYKQLHGALTSETEYNETVAEILSIMGSICLADGKIPKCSKLLKKCLEIQIAVYGTQHRKSRETQNILNTLQK